MSNYIELAETTRKLSDGWCQVDLGPTICTQAMSVVARLAGIEHRPTTLTLETEHGERIPVAPHDIRGLTRIGQTH